MSWPSVPAAETGLAGLLSDLCFEFGQAGLQLFELNELRGGFDDGTRSGNPGGRC
jgi:hypothetical protein